ncbi:MAG: Crp/Fnr family transcriptional regulator [Gammaproteobacteria bacterium]|nr:Crp/Fnr family transcriptional regulator [Gammaproteobacteria bacterium]
MNDGFSRHPDFMGLIQKEFPLLYQQRHRRSLRHRERLDLSSVTRKNIYVLDTAIVSLGADLSDGRSAEVAILGSGAILGVCQLYRWSAPPYFATVRQAGDVWELDLATLKAEFANSPVLIEQLGFAMEHIFVQATRSAICNRLHHIDQQLAKTLLLYQDLTARHDLQVTQQELAELLGVRREGVTQAMGKLQAMGAIETSRGRIYVHHRQQLEQHACECYRPISASVHSSFTAEPMQAGVCRASQRRFKNTMSAADKAKTPEIKPALISALP